MMCLPGSKAQRFGFVIEKRTLKMEYQGSEEYLAAVPVISTRPDVWDLLCLDFKNGMEIVTYGGLSIPLEANPKDIRARPWIGNDDPPMADTGANIPIHLVDSMHSSVTVIYLNGSKFRMNVNLIPSDQLTYGALELLASHMPPDQFIILHKRFLRLWCEEGWTSQPNLQFDCIIGAITTLIECLSATEVEDEINPFHAVLNSVSGFKLRDDAALRGLDIPKIPLRQKKPKMTQVSRQDKVNMVACLVPLHFLGEAMRLYLPAHERLSKLATLLIRLAKYAAPGWADYWKRLYPDAGEGWQQSGI